MQEAAARSRPLWRQRCLWSAEKQRWDGGNSLQRRAWLAIINPTHMATEAHLQPPLVESLDEFLQLEAKITRVVENLRAARDARARAEAELTELKGKHAGLKQEYTRAEQELIELRKEREEVRRRVEKLAAQLETLSGE